MKILEHLICFVNPASVPSKDTMTLDSLKVLKLPQTLSFPITMTLSSESDQKMRSLAGRVNLLL